MPKTPVQTALLVTAFRARCINNADCEVIRPTLCKKALKVSEAAVAARFSTRLHEQRR